MLQAMPGSERGAGAPAFMVSGALSLETAALRPAVRAVIACVLCEGKDHPDVDPSHEALMLAEWFRELARRPESVAHGETFVAWLKDTENAAMDLSKAVEKGKVDPKAAQAAFDRAQASCTACHAQHRDNAAAWKHPPAK